MANLFELKPPLKFLHFWALLILNFIYVIRTFLDTTSSSSPWVLLLVGVDCLLKDILPLLSFVCFPSCRVQIFFAPVYNVFIPLIVCCFFWKICWNLFFLIPRSYLLIVEVFVIWCVESICSISSQEQISSFYLFFLRPSFNIFSVTLKLILLSIQIIRHVNLKKILMFIRIREISLLSNCHHKSTLLSVIM